MNKHLNLLFTAIGNICRNKVRSIVLILCLIAVLFPFVTAISISEGIKFQSLVSIEEGADIYVTEDYFGSNAPISLDYVGRFKKMEGVTKVFPRIVGRAYFTNRLATLVGIFPENLPESIRLSQGTMFHEKGDVIVGEGLAREFRLQPGVRFSLSINTSKLLRIVGVFDSNATIWSANLILMSFEDAAEFFKVKGKATDILIYTRSGYAPILAKQIQENVNASTSGSPETPLRVQDKTLVKRYFERGFNYKAGVFTALYTVAFALAIPALLIVSGFGQTERRKEIGIIKATGWQTQEVMEMVVLENLMISLMSAPLAILTSMVWLKWFNGAFIAQFFIAEIGLMAPFPVPSRFLPLPCLFAFIFAIVLTMVGSLYSTWRVATVPPVEAMR
ncbi:MAG TPA: FtsX-like permease family protein [Thermodesulfobacteriota bacterium]|nr:FtsX-like permease family protein [Thermodesulfobacteriota bacterium]